MECYVQYVLSRRLPLQTLAIGEFELTTRGVLLHVRTRRVYHISAFRTSTLVAHLVEAPLTFRFPSAPRPSQIRLVQSQRTAPLVEARDRCRWLPAGRRRRTTRTPHRSGAARRRASPRPAAPSPRISPPGSPAPPQSRHTPRVRS